MSDVSMIGLGNMGAALARALVERGFGLTVWNRSPEKAGPLAAKGAQLAPDASAAIAASPVTLICVTNYAVSDRILSDAAASLAGKVLVQLSTGTPQQARVGEAWAEQQGAEYLEAAITGGPDSIGTPDAHILLSGKEAVFHKAEPALRALADKLDFKGEGIGLAAAWDLAMIMHYYGRFLSLFHSIQICQAEGIPLEQFSALLGAQGKGYEQWLCESIRTGNYQETSAPLELWAGGIRLIAEHARDCGVNAEFPAFTSALFQKAMAAGYGREEVSAVYKVLKS